MDNGPTTSLFKSLNKTKLPTQYLYVVLKQLFQFGCEKIYIINDQVQVKLHYSLKGENLKKKLGNLPCSYLKLNLENDVELEMLQEITAKFNFSTTGEASLDEDGMGIMLGDKEEDENYERRNKRLRLK